MSFFESSNTTFNIANIFIHLVVRQIRSITKSKSSESSISSQNEAVERFPNPYLKKPKIINNRKGGGAKKWIFLVSSFLVILLVLGVFSPSINNNDIPNNNNFGEDQLDRNGNSAKISVVLYSSPTCGCCHNYVAYLNENGFDVFQKRTEAYMDIKDENLIPQEQRSCHTAIIGDYFVEGHIPVRVVYDFLDSESDQNGIALPNMPSGSPGMTGEKDQDWIIYSILNGHASIFTTL